MAAEVESMFSGNRVVPWHGLGEIVEGTLCSADAIKKAGLDWKVESKPIFTDNGMEIPNYKANVRDLDNKVLGVVTDRYAIVQNEDAFKFTDSLIGENCQYETAGSLQGGKRIFLLAKMPEKKIVDDKFDNFICFTNSHDGLGSVKAFMTPVRVVCQNTLNLALSKASRTWSTKHVGDISSKLDEAKRTLELAEEYMEELAVVADKLAHTKLSEDQAIKIIDELYPQSNDMSIRQQATIAEAKQNIQICMLAPDIAKFKGTAWQLMNAISDYATHKEPKRNTDTYKENNFYRTLNGNILIDNTFMKLMANVK